MKPELAKKNEKYFAVMPRVRRIGDTLHKLQVIPPGRFSFMDGKDVQGVDDLVVCEMVCEEKHHGSQVFILHCVHPSGCYSCDRNFVQNYLFETLEEAKAKIARVLKGRIVKLKRRLAQ